jgi:hypothetical protein
MNKTYKFLLFFLILLLLILNLVFFSYDKKFMAQFENGEETKSAKDIISSLEKKDEPSSFFDLDILGDQRFKDLRDFKVDLDDFSFIDGLTPSDPEDEDAPVVQPGPEFETGNPNPFRPQF